MELLTIFRLLRKRIWILLTVPFVAALAAFVFTMNMDKKYKSTAQLSTGFTTVNRIQLIEEKVSLYDAGIKFNNLIEAMNSELILSLLSYRLILHDLKEEEPFRVLKESEEVDGLSSLNSDSAIVFFERKLEKMEVLSKDNPLERDMVHYLERLGYINWAIKSSISIRRNENTDYVSVICITENPNLSAFAVNALSEEYIRYDNYIKNSISNESVTFFSNLANEKKKVLEEKTALLSKFKAENGVFTDEMTSFGSDQIADYELLRQDKLNRIRGLTLSIENTDKWIQKLESNSESSGTSMNTKILELRKRINELNEIYISTGASDTELLGTITNLREQLQVEMNKLATTQSGNQSIGLSLQELIARRDQFELELEIERGNLASINSTILAMRNSMTGSVSKESTIDALQREIQTASDEYLQVLDKYNVERNKSLLSGTSTKLVIRGQPNGSPESSKRMIIIGLSSLGSFSMCVFVLILIEFADPRIKYPSRFESLANITLLGSINLIPIKNLDLSALFKANTTNAGLENYKHLLRKIRFEIVNSGGQVILFTSNKSGEGKSFTILSLAYSLSLLNKRILIIDTNFRNNTLTKSLIAKPNFKLMLTEWSGVKLIEGGSNDSNDNMGNIVTPTGDRNIDVIGTGMGTQSPSELFAGRNFEGMLRHFRDQYEYIFLEGASLNDYSDTKELMSFADKVIQIFSAESIIKQEDRESINYLLTLKEKFLGAILNKVELKELV